MCLEFHFGRRRPSAFSFLAKTVRKTRERETENPGFNSRGSIQKMMTRKEEQLLKKTVPLLRLTEKDFIQVAGKFQLNSLFQSLLNKLPTLKTN
jgi:hypothetical protein